MLGSLQSVLKPGPHVPVARYYHLLLTITHLFLNSLQDLQSIYALKLKFLSPLTLAGGSPWERVAHLATVVMAVLANLENNHRDLEISPSPAEACNGRSWEPVLCWAVSLKNRRARKCKDLTSHCLLTLVFKNMVPQSFPGKPMLALAWYLPFAQTPLHSDPPHPHEDLSSHEEIAPLSSA